MNSDGLPTFEFSTLEEHISQLLPELIENFIKNMKPSYRGKYFNDDLEFYSVRIPDGRNNFLTAIKIKNSCSFLSVKDVDERYQQDIIRLYNITLMTKSVSSFAINLKYGQYAMDYFQAFLDINNTELAYSFIQQYKKATAVAVQAEHKKLLLDHNIKAIYQIAKSTQQYKDIYNQNPQYIKNYCDGDFECYFINEYTLNIVCYASSILYSCVFDKNGYYKVYAQRIHYGQHCERLAKYLNDIDDKELDEHFEVSLINHMYKNEFIIFGHSDTGSLAYDFMIVDLLAITNFIVKAEASA